MTPEYIREILCALLDGALISAGPDRDTGHADLYWRARADALREAIAEIDRQTAMEKEGPGSEQI